jgi:hypothetical protein
MKIFKEKQFLICGVIYAQDDLPTRRYHVQQYRYRYFRGCQWRICTRIQYRNKYEVRQKTFNSIEDAKLWFSNFPGNDIHKLIAALDDLNGIDY